MKTTLVLGACVALGIIGCRKEEVSYESPPVAVVVQRAVIVVTPVEPRAPEVSTLSSAATPLGWADEAERRQSEEDYARGTGEPPHAIGGGPVDFSE